MNEQVPIENFIESLKKSSIDSLRLAEVEVRRSFDDLFEIIFKLRNEIQNKNIKILELEEKLKNAEKTIS